MSSSAISATACVFVPGNVADRDAAPRGRSEVDGVDADADLLDEPQAGGRRDDL